MVIEEKLEQIGLSLPSAAEPSFQYVPVTVHAGVAYVSGQLLREDGEVRITGKVGGGVDVQTAVLDATQKIDSGPFSLLPKDLMMKALEVWKDCGLPEFQVPKRAKLRLEKS